MSLVGTRLGSYEVRALIGAGGMGEVYRAHDLQLQRDVAVKSLPASFDADPERIVRFEREARILAGLNHPGIATIHGLEQAGSDRYIILELIEGGTLADRISAGPLPLRDTLRIARDVADALHAAHEKGVVHRDLKPSNIALTVESRPKVLDFGLAKTAAVGGGATTVAQATAEGMVLGTAPYMSPEQTRGIPVDKRSDIWAFGCVLFEMLTGRRAFSGSTSSEVALAILEREPDFNQLPAATPHQVTWLLRRCLEKNPEQRLHDIADARIELDEALSKPAPGPMDVSSRRSSGPRVGQREMAAWLVATAAIVTALAMLIFRTAPMEPGEAGVSYRLPLILPDSLRFVSGDPASRFEISPDGTRLAMIAADASGASRLWLQSLNSPDVRPLPGTEGAAFPFWSPDSTSVAFIARPPGAGMLGSEGRLMRVDLAGGLPVTLADRVGFNATGAWGPDDVILFTPSGNGPLYRLSAAAPGAPVVIGSLDLESGDVQHSFPSFLPDGRHFVYTVIGSTRGANEARGVYLGSLDGEKPRLLIDAGSQARYASGHLLFLRDATLFAWRFDPESLTLQGDPRPIAEQLQITNRLSGGTGAFSVSSNGALVYQTGVGVRSQLTWVDRRGQTLKSVGEQADLVDVRLSPDGTRAAVSRLDPLVGTRDIWTYNLVRNLAERFTTEPSDEFAPVWSPPGDRIAYTSTRDGSIQIFEQPLDRSAPPRKVDAGTSPLGKFAAAWSPDGQSLLFIAGGRALSRSDLHQVPMHEGGVSAPLVESPFIETQVRFSPDGRWIAFVSNDTGRMEVYLRPFPSGGTPTRVSLQGGSWPAWRKDGREIFFLSLDGSMMAATVSLDGNLRIDEPQRLFNVRLRPMGRLDAYSYDVTGDGQQFLMNTFVEEATSTGLTLLVNWPAVVR